MHTYAYLGMEIQCTPHYYVILQVVIIPAGVLTHTVRLLLQLYDVNCRISSSLSY